MIRGHNVMKGYWNRAGRDRRGDARRLVRTPATWRRVDEDGYFFIVDRKKDMIIRGGYNVYPREIEEVLYEHPAVSEAAVVGVPDDVAGRGGRRGGRAEGRRRGDRGRHPRVRQGARRRLQVPAPDLVLRRAAQGSDGQDPQARGSRCPRRSRTNGAASPRSMAPSATRTPLSAGTSPRSATRTWPRSACA